MQFNSYLTVQFTETNSVNYMETSSPPSLEWHTSESLNTAVHNFHDRYARQPLQQLNRAKQIHHQFRSTIETYLRSKRICCRLEYTGSSYEGVKVSKNAEDADLEFDVIIVLTQGNKLTDYAEDDNPGYAVLKPKPGCGESDDLQGMLSYKGVFGFLTGNTYVDATKLRNLFFGEIQKCINDSSTMSGKAKLRLHGPAVQMDVYPDSGVVLWGTKLYSVDLVPAFEVNGQLYVAKPLKHEDMPHQAWRLSFSLQEKRKLDAADQGNGVRKQVFRTLKVIRNREPGLSRLTSYHLKTALFRQMDNDYNNWSWTRRDLGCRLMGVLGELENCLDSGNMPHYFLHGVNLLDGISPSCITNMRDRIRRLRTAENQMMKLLNS